jgi:hypothetical protein
MFFQTSPDRGSDRDNVIQNVGTWVGRLTKAFIKMSNCAGVALATPPHPPLILVLNIDRSYVNTTHTPDVSIGRILLLILEFLASGQISETNIFRYDNYPLRFFAKGGFPVKRYVFHMCISYGKV